jgi:hypothetical protein
VRHLRADRGRETRVDVRPRILDLDALGLRELDELAAL